MELLVGTCSIVACIVCLEAVHRLEYEKVHGEGTFPCTLMAEALQKLFDECCRDETWKPNEDCYVEDVLNKIQEMRPVLLVTAGVPARALPLGSWQDHGLAGRSPEFVAALLNSHGPCIGVLCMCPWYHHFDAGRDDTLVYRGCGRCERDMDLAEELYGDQVVSHVIVCFAYRFCGDDDDLTNQQMHVLVRDNHWAADNGPQRWVDVEELTTLYTLSVESLID
ncbi:hypothetical protein HU200_050988 [Digitaria exilis]|uniref:Uncharacterized protein n=1 Tax=Digitaria exilis TaxID=1010633 RepID=A0A835AQM6_9POAL|nr:hypothetical protein HU200_050988 [Digitaria exilis]CAB3479825.1 unnamed protein product [Digitaria exilis]